MISEISRAAPSTNVAPNQRKLSTDSTVVTTAKATRSKSADLGKRSTPLHRPPGSNAEKDDVSETSQNFPIASPEKPKFAKSNSAPLMRTDHAARSPSANHNDSEGFFFSNLLSDFYVLSFVDEICYVFVLVILFNFVCKLNSLI